MGKTSVDVRGQIQSLPRPALERLQLEKLNRLLAHVHAKNTFYQRKLAGTRQQLQGLDQLAELPATTKDDLQPASGGEPFAVNHTYPIEHYVRFHQTSGTRGRPLAVLDTDEDWPWWIECWQYVLDAAEITRSDRVLLAFSFGPFAGFWSAFDALIDRGTLVLPGGGLSSLARIDLIRRAKATAVFCTPSYALRLGHVAAEHKIDLRRLSVEKVVVAGEPGGSVPAFRERIETMWGATVIDHGGSTEVGAWGFADGARRGLLVNEAEFIPEFCSVETGQPARNGELSHLILTSLGRWGGPVIRYRTGDVVRPVWRTDDSSRAAQDVRFAAPASPSPSPSHQWKETNLESGFVLLDGGIVSRADDMMIIRGVNVFPSAVEQILHSFPEVVEYRMTARKRNEMDELVIEVEDHLMRPERIAEELLLRLGLKVEVRCVPAMSLPRFEAKGQRFVDERKS